MGGVTAVWLAARAQLRRRWVPTAALILLVGLAGGAVLAAVAGASRTDTAMRRFVAYSRPEDVYVSIGGAGGDPSQPPVPADVLADRARLVALPEVAEVGRAPYLVLSPDQAGDEVLGINIFGAADGQAFRTIDRPLVLEGRRARLDRADEAIVDDTTARRRHLKVESTVTLWSYSPDQRIYLSGGGLTKIGPPEGPSYTVTIVGTCAKRPRSTPRRHRSSPMPPSWDRGPWSSRPPS